MVAEIEAFPRASLSPDDQINYDVFRYQYRMTVEGFKYRYQLIRTDSYGGVQNSEQVVDMLTFTSTKDYDDWLARLAAFPAYIDQNIALMREGIRTNVLLPKVIVSRVRTQLDGQAKGDPAASGFYRPFAHFSASRHRDGPGAIVRLGSRARAHGGHPGVREAARLHRSRIPARLLRPDRLVADEQRPGRLRVLRPAPHDDGPHAAADSRASA